MTPGDVGETAYDDLGERDQALMRSEWDERVSERLARLNLAEEFVQEGRSWTEADEQGRAVEVTPASGPCASRDELLGACELGATQEELHALLGERLPVFHEWMRGQTMGLCPKHGAAVYRYDLERFLDGCP